MSARLGVLGRHGVLHDDDVVAGQVHGRADSAVEPDELLEVNRLAHGLDRDVDRRAAGDEDALLELAHAHDARRRRVGGDEVIVGQLRDRVTDLLVDGPRDLAALHVG